MNEPPIKYRNNPDLSLLPHIFSAFHDIRAVYLFGSTNSTRINRESDLDLAVLSDSGNLHQHRLEILTALAGKGFCHVDLVFLDTNDIVLKYEAVSPNRLIYQREDFERGTYYSKIIRQYLDFLPYLNVQRAAYKRRILNGQT
jgi:predicted nucleotidyltransferase